MHNRSGKDQPLDRRHGAYIAELYAKKFIPILAFSLIASELLSTQTHQTSVIRAIRAKEYKPVIPFFAFVGFLAHYEAMSTLSNGFNKFGFNLFNPYNRQQAVKAIKQDVAEIEKQASIEEVRTRFRKHVPK